MVTRPQPAVHMQTSAMLAALLAGVWRARPITRKRGVSTMHQHSAGHHNTNNLRSLLHHGAASHADADKRPVASSKTAAPAGIIRKGPSALEIMRFKRQRAARLIQVCVDSACCCCLLFVCVCGQRPRPVQAGADA